MTEQHIASRERYVAAIVDRHQSGESIESIAADYQTERLDIVNILAAYQAGVRRLVRASAEKRTRHRATRIRGVEQVIAKVAERYGISGAAIRGKQRTKTVVQARHAAMVIARKRTGASYPELARAFNRHHTTIISALQGATRPAIAMAVEAIEAWMDRQQEGTEAA